VSRTGRWTIGDGAGGPVAALLHAALADHQRGRVPDRYGWLDRLPASPGAPGPAASPAAAFGQERA
jgi:hypothetical protein